MNFDKIYFKPKIEREEPEVIRVISTSEIKEDQKVSYEESITKLKNRLNYLSTSFNALNKDHYKILDVYKKRAEMLKISLPIQELAKKDKNIENASKVLFGGLIKSLPFNKYIELLIKEQNISSTIISTHIATEDTPENILEKANIQSNPYVQSAASIKNAYKDYLIENELHDFLAVHFHINSIFKNTSAKASVDQTADDVNKKTDLANEIEEKSSAPEPLIRDGKNDLMEFLEDCIPCAARYINILGNTSFADEYEKFTSLFNERLNVAIGELIISKLHLLRFRFLGDLCSLINHLTNFVCIPDLAAIIALLKMLAFKLQTAISGEWNFNLDIAGSLITSILQSVVDALMAMLMQLIMGAFSAVNCIITDLEFQSKKLQTPLFDYSFTFEGSAAQAGILGAFDTLKDELGEGKAYVDGLIKSLEDTFSKMLNFSDSSSIFELHGKLNSTLSMISLVNEIYALSKAYSELAPGQSSLEAVCKAAYGGQSPWINFLTNLPDEIKDSLADYANNRNQDVEEDGQSTEDDNGNNDFFTDDENDGDADEELLVIVDTSLDPKFFEDDPIENILSDPYHGSIPELPSSLESGSGAIDFSDKLNEYKGIKNILTSNYKVLSGAQENYSISSSYLPVGIIDFSSCISSSNIPNSQINEWINKIKN